MDAVDRQILAELQQDGRVTLTELAERVGLSLSPCHRRLRALEHSGAISGYHAHLDPNALGLTFEALVFVTMRAADRASVDAFEHAVTAVPHVRQAQRLFGDPDYLLRVIARRSARLPTALRRPPRHPPRRATPQLHPGHEKRRRKPSPPTLTQDRAEQTPLDKDVLHQSRSLTRLLFQPVTRGPSTGHRGARVEERLLGLIARTSRRQIRMDPSSVMVQPWLCATSHT